MADGSMRLNVTLPAEQHEKLSRIAQRTHVREGTLASSLLSQAIDEADPGASSVLAHLDRIPGACERIETGVAEARTGRTVPFGEPR
jgi:predicted transcriptional regulator